MTAAKLWWNEEDPQPDFVVNAPFPDVQIGFSLAKASVAIVGKNFRLYVQGLNTDQPCVGYLQTRRGDPLRRWRISNALSRTNFGRPDGQRVRIAWQSGQIVILRISDRNDVFLQFEIASVRLEASAIELITRGAYVDFATAYKSAFQQPWSTGEEEANL